MGAYICNQCDWLFCSHEVNCYEDLYGEPGLICEDCHTKLSDPEES